jgi:hypothetical protein
MKRLQKARRYFQSDFLEYASESHSGETAVHPAAAIFNSLLKPGLSTLILRLLYDRKMMKMNPSELYGPHSCHLATMGRYMLLGQD